MRQLLHLLLAVAVATVCEQLTAAQTVPDPTDTAVPTTLTNVTTPAAPISTATPTCSVNGYVGCYADMWWDRQLPNMIANYVSVAQCRAFALAANYTYYGLQGITTQECWAGFTLPPLNQSSSGCVVGGDGLAIGGNFALAVYDVACPATAAMTTLPPIASPCPSAAYVNCYVEAPQRQLTELLAPAGGSLASCIALATAANYSYAGLQWYGECWAGWTLPTLGLATNCDTPCPDGVGNCGGLWALAIYNITTCTLAATTDAPITIADTTTAAAADTLAPTSEAATTVAPTIATDTATAAPTSTAADLNLTTGCYQNCFWDAWYDRQLPNQLDVGQQHAVAQCQQLAAAGGYVYYGLQGLGECWAGSSLPTLGLTNGCLLDDLGQPCGGNYALSVYSTNSCALPTVPPTPTDSPTTTADAATTVPTTDPATTLPTTTVNPTTAADTTIALPTTVLLATSASSLPATLPSFDSTTSPTEAGLTSLPSTTVLDDIATAAPTLATVTLPVTTVATPSSATPLVTVLSPSSSTAPLPSTLVTSNSSAVTQPIDLSKATIAPLFSDVDAAAALQVVAQQPLSNVTALTKVLLAVPTEQVNSTANPRTYNVLTQLIDIILSSMKSQSLVVTSDLHAAVAGMVSSLVTGGTCEQVIGRYSSIRDVIALGNQQRVVTQEFSGMNTDLNRASYVAVRGGNNTDIRSTTNVEVIRYANKISGCLNYTHPSLASRVVSIRMLAGQQTLEVNDTSLDISFNMTLTQAQAKTQSSAVPRCVWYDPKTAATSADGCTTSNVTARSDNTSYVTCSCNHLTEFAILYQMMSQPSLAVDAMTNVYGGTSNLVWAAIYGTVATVSLVQLMRVVLKSGVKYYLLLAEHGLLFALSSVRMVIMLSYYLIRDESVFNLAQLSLMSVAPHALSLLLYSGIAFAQHTLCSKAELADDAGRAIRYYQCVLVVVNVVMTSMMLAITVPVATAAVSLDVAEQLTSAAGALSAVLTAVALLAVTQSGAKIVSALTHDFGSVYATKLLRVTQAIAVSLAAKTIVMVYLLVSPQSLLASAVSLSAITSAYSLADVIGQIAVLCLFVRGVQQSTTPKRGSVFQSGRRNSVVPVACHPQHKLQRRQSETVLSMASSTVVRPAALPHIDVRLLSCGDTFTHQHKGSISHSMRSNFSTYQSSDLNDSVPVAVEPVLTAIDDVTIDSLFVDPISAELLERQQSDTQGTGVTTPARETQSAKATSSARFITWTSTPRKPAWHLQQADAAAGLSARSQSVPSDAARR